MLDAFDRMFERDSHGPEVLVFAFFHVVQLIQRGLLAKAVLTFFSFPRLLLLLLYLPDSAAGEFQQHLFIKQLRLLSDVCLNRLLALLMMLE